MSRSIALAIFGSDMSWSMPACDMAQLAVFHVVFGVRRHRRHFVSLHPVELCSHNHGRHAGPVIQMGRVERLAVLIIVTAAAKAAAVDCPSMVSCRSCPRDSRPCRSHVAFGAGGQDSFNSRFPKLLLNLDKLADVIESCK